MGSPNSSVDELTRIFNSALVTTRAESLKDFTTELFGLVESPAFRAILAAIRQHARNYGLSEKEAAEQIIQTFRKVDRIWADYIYQEGVDRLRGRNGASGSHQP